MRQANDLKSKIRQWYKMGRTWLAVTLAILILNGQVGCRSFKPSPRPTPTPLSLSQELILYNWPLYMPQVVLDDFDAEYGVKIVYLTYDSGEEAADTIKAGKIVYDVAIIDNDLIPPLTADGLLAEIDFQNVPNFKNISANFRDLAYDPGNRHSVPYGWGTTGLLVRTDLVQAPVTSWADLWDERYAGRVGVPEEPTELISVALKALGYPLNSEDPAQLEAALDHLLKLKKSLVFVESEEPEAVERLVSGEVVILLGYSGHALIARKENPAIQYVLPKEGTLLWGDSLVISAASPNQHTAEIFLNYILRPQVSARIVKEYYYATANEAAYPFLDPEILDDPVLFPPVEYLTKNDFYAPLSPQGQKLYADVWERFMAASQ
jgi:spermidine/putrescine transport system substrate-binding protein